MIKTTKRSKMFYFGTILTVIFSISLINRFLKFKYDDGMNIMQVFYQQERESIDLLVIGSSHAYQDINTNIIWDEMGVPAFDLCGSCAPMWSSYHYLVEALKTQTPKLVCLEAYCLTLDFEYADDKTIMKNLYGMRPSKNKFDALFDSVPNSRIKEFAFEYVQFHNRYKELSSEDFWKDKNNSIFYSSWKGAGDNFLINEYYEPRVKQSNNKAIINAKEELYFRKILELCKNNNIDIVVIVSPYWAYCESDRDIFNTAKDVAKEYDVDFINFNEDYSIIEYDWKKDFSDQAHMSYLGNPKFTKYLCENVFSNYNLKSKKGIEKYKSWDAGLLYYNNRMENERVKSINDINSYAALLIGMPQRYKAFVSVKGALSVYEDASDMYKYFSKMGINTIDDEGERAYVLQHEECDVVENSNVGYYYGERIGNQEIYVNGTGVYWNGINQEKTDCGVNIVIVDMENECIVDSIGINWNEMIR